MDVGNVARQKDGLHVRSGVCGDERREGIGLAVEKEIEGKTTESRFWFE